MDLTLDDLKEGLVATKNTVEVRSWITAVVLATVSCDPFPTNESTSINFDHCCLVIPGLLTSHTWPEVHTRNQGSSNIYPAVEAAMAPIKQELKELRKHLPDADAEASAEQAILEKLEEVDSKIKGFQKELQESAEKFDKGPLQAAIAPIKQEIKELRKHLPDADAEASAEQAILEKLEEASG
eukprot:Skav231832  [mRNA]  locus=scaffold4309:73765:82165:+ [translate_table: standard]